jgi:hypothetical protein
MGKSLEYNKRKTCKRKTRRSGAFIRVSDAMVAISKNWRNGGIIQEFYTCDVCDNFHLTSGGLK